MLPKLFVKQDTKEQLIKALEHVLNVKCHTVYINVKCHTVYILNSQGIETVRYQFTVPLATTP